MVYRGEVSGKAVKVVEFPAFAACALAGIGDLPDTILDRSVIIAMKRRAPHEHVEPFRDRLARPKADPLRERIAAWAETHLERLQGAWPDMPETIVDRAADVWEPLVAVADQAGGHWPNLARHAAVTLNMARAERDPSLGIQLLADCRLILAATGADRITTERLVAALVELAESPWADLRGKPIDARGVARRLRKYDVRPADHRFDEGTRKGYRREDFHDAWQRYLPAFAPVAHVAHPAGETRPDGAVASTEDRGGYDLHKVLRTSSTNSSTPSHVPGDGQGQQAQHQQLDEDHHDRDNGGDPASSASKSVPPATIEVAG